MKISRILHAGYLFETSQARVVFDPIFESPFSVNGYAFPEISFDTAAIRKLKFDAVFISHYHDDHCSFLSLDLIDRATPIYLFCAFEEIFEMIRDLGFQNVTGLMLNRPVEVNGITITPRRALDEDVDCIFQIEDGTHKVLNVVDSWIDSETLELLTQEGPWDLILWPFQTMREIEAIAPESALPASRRIPEEWVPQLKRLSPRGLVASSCQFRFEEWSWLNWAFFPISYAGFKAQVEEILPRTEVFRLNPGRALELVEHEILGADPLPWIKPLGDQNVDYEYDPDFRVPGTDEIALRFPKLDLTKSLRVERFLTHELPVRFRELDPTEDDVFASPRIWKLSIYDGPEVSTHHFLVNANFLEPVSEALPQWTTEVIAFKLFEALENGESLSSLYLRVGHSEILNDPLIRVLYNGKIGSYQRAQLRALGLKVEQS